MPARMGVRWATDHAYISVIAAIKFTDTWVLSSIGSISVLAARLCYSRGYAAPAIRAKRATTAAFCEALADDIGR